jgi:hypothetical protein
MLQTVSPGNAATVARRPNFAALPLCAPSGLFQLASALEILHAALGLVGGSPLTALMQWAGRSNVLFGVVAAVPEVQGAASVGIMLWAWALSEVIRYPWYATSLVGACPSWLTWLRWVCWWLRVCMGGWVGEVGASSSLWRLCCCTAVWLADLGLRFWILVSPLPPAF